jgi:hypothetical protein
MKTVARMAIAAFLLTALSFAKDHNRRDRYRYDDDYRYRSQRYEYRNYDRGSNLPPGIQKRLRNGKGLPPGQAKKLNRDYRYYDRGYRYNDRDRYYDRNRYYDRYDYRYWR